MKLNIQDINMKGTPLIKSLLTPLNSGTEIIYTPAQRIWHHSVNPANLIDGAALIYRALKLLFISGGSVLYGLIAAEEKQGEEPLLFWTYVMCTAVCPAVAFFNSLNAYLIRRDARLPKKGLEDITIPRTTKLILREDAIVFTTAAISSIGLTTTSSRYPKIDNDAFRWLWILYTQAVNTLLHLLPVILAAFENPYVYPLKILKFFIFDIFVMIYKFCCKPSPTTKQILYQESKKQADLYERKLKSAFKNRLDEIFTQKVKSMEFQSDSLSYKPIDVTELLEMDFNTLMVTDHNPPEITPPHDWQVALDQKIGEAGGLAGGVFVGFSCNGYMWDTVKALQEIGLQFSEAVLASATAIYLLWVLLFDIGRNSGKEHAQRLFGVLTGRDMAPYHAKFGFKTFIIHTLLNGFCANFSYAAAIRTVKDRLSDAPKAIYNSSYFFSNWGIRLLAFFSVWENGRYYFTEWVRLSPENPHQSVAHLHDSIQLSKEQFNVMTPRATVESAKAFVKYTGNEVQLAFKISKEQLQILVEKAEEVLKQIEFYEKMEKAKIVEEKEEEKEEKKAKSCWSCCGRVLTKISSYCYSFYYNSSSPPRLNVLPVSRTVTGDSDPSPLLDSSKSSSEPSRVYETLGV